MNDNNDNQNDNQKENHNVEIVDAEILSGDVSDLDFDDNMDEVFELTQYTESEVSAKSDSFIVAEYENIEIGEATKNQTKIAKKFVHEAEKLILSYGSSNGTEYGSELKGYVRSITNLQLSQLGDLLSLVEINKKMLENMVRRINSVQADDYALVQTYTSLLQQHIKLHRETQNTFSNIPSLMKKMVVDINEDLLSNKTPDNLVIGANHGISQFNNSKEMIKSIKAKQEAKLSEANKNDSGNK